MTLCSFRDRRYLCGVQVTKEKIDEAEVSLRLFGFVVG